MDFLEKLNVLMAREQLNKSTLSKACGIPYTTIDGWYKKGYEGLKLTTLCKLAGFFGTSLDFWVDGETAPPEGLDEGLYQLARPYSLLNETDKALVAALIHSLAEKAALPSAEK